MTDSARGDVRRFLGKLSHLVFLGFGQIVVGVTVGVAVGVFSTLALTSWSGKQRTRTEIRLFSPVVGDFKQVANDRGPCSGFSNDDPAAPEAHLCIGRLRNGRSSLYDPCWETRQGPSLLCVQDPWSDAATVFLPSLGLSRAPRPSIRRAGPWAIELDNGEHCVSVAAATYTIAGQRANYFCGGGSGFRPDSSEGGWVVGMPDRTLALWLVSFIGTGSDSTGQVPVDVAWY
jgi:hypothetical protein